MQFDGDGKCVTAADHTRSIRDAARALDAARARGDPSPPGRCSARRSHPHRTLAPRQSRVAAAGKLRAAINFGNPILHTRDALTGEARGVSVDYWHANSRVASAVPVELVLYTSAGRCSTGATKNAWDVAFLAIDRCASADSRSPQLT
jgi:hypothetical protein